MNRFQLLKQATSCFIQSLALPCVDPPHRLRFCVFSCVSNCLSPTPGRGRSNHSPPLLWIRSRLEGDSSAALRVREGLVKLAYQPHSTQHNARDGTTIQDHLSFYDTSQSFQDHPVASNESLISSVGQSIRHPLSDPGSQVPKLTGTLRTVEPWQRKGRAQVRPQGVFSAHHVF